MLCEMFIELSWCWQTVLPELKKVEQAFHISQLSWNRAKMVYGEQKSLPDAEEIYFFRNVKPIYISELGYCSLLYNSLLYVSDAREQQRKFWEQEGRRLEKFKEKNIEFITYYESRDTSLDEFYFLQRNAHKFPNRSKNPYDLEDELFSAKDYLITAYLTEKRYQVYVNSMLG